MAAGRSAWRRWPPRSGEQRDTIEEVIEPYLIQQGLLQRSPRGRMLTITGYRHLGLTPPRNQAQLDLLAAQGSEAADE